MMTILTELSVVLAWVQSPAGANVVQAAIVVAGLCGLPERWCLWLSLALHLVLML